MISVHLSAFLDFVKIFIRYRPKQRTRDGFHYGFFPIKKLFLQNENLNKFRQCLFKAYILISVRKPATLPKFNSEML